MKKDKERGGKVKSSKKIVHVCGKWEGWDVCEWVSTCVLDLDLELANYLLAWLALGVIRGVGGDHKHRGASAMGTHTP